MSYSVAPITSINDIPALVRSFAATLGFTATTVSATSITVKHPTYTTAKTFSVYVDNTGSGLTLRERIAITCDAPGAVGAWAESPKFNKTQVDSDAAVVVEQPTKLHLFGALAGDASAPGKSFIAGVIEYGYNLYRHFYLGYVEKITAFEGGEIVTGSACWPTPDSVSGANVLPYDDALSTGGVGHVYPFSCTHVENETIYRAGGCFIDHANNPTPWRKFSFGGSYSNSGFDATFATYGDIVILGGFKDSINSGYLCAGKSPFAGVEILVPVNLYIGKRVSSSQYIQAVGRPSGVRMVHMEDLDPGQEITVGTSVWRVFPVFKKSIDPSSRRTNAALSSGRRFPTDNSSYYVGMAYLVSE